MSKLTKHQIRVLEILREGGRLFQFEFPLEYSLDDKDDNTLRFRRDTFKAIEDFIEVAERPALGACVYGLSDIGREFLNSKQ